MCHGIQGGTKHACMHWARAALILLVHMRLASDECGWQLPCNCTGQPRLSCIRREQGWCNSSYASLCKRKKSEQHCSHQTSTSRTRRLALPFREINARCGWERECGCTKMQDVCGERPQHACKSQANAYMVRTSKMCAWDKQHAGPEQTGWIEDTNRSCR